MTKEITQREYDNQVESVRQFAQEQRDTSYAALLRKAMDGFDKIIAETDCARKAAESDGLKGGPLQSATHIKIDLIESYARAVRDEIKGVIG